MVVRGYGVNHPETNQVVAEFNLCKTFGWTLEELYRQPARHITYFASIIAEENRIAKAKQMEMDANNAGRK